MQRQRTPVRYDRFGDWSEAICDLVMDVSARPAEDGGAFRAAISSRAIGAASMSRFRSKAHRILRSAERIRQSHHDDYLIGFQRRGRAFVECGDSRFVLEPGNLAVVDCASPFALDFPEDVERQIVRVPRALFNAASGVDRLRNGLHLHGDGLTMRLLRHYFDEFGEAADGEIPPDLIYDLCRLIKGGSAASEASGPPNDGLWLRLRDLVDDCLTDPDLSLTGAAAALGVSARTIQREFSSRGMTFRSHVLGRRLEMAAAQLRDSRFGACSITAIALRWGFSDTAHFSRVFRQRYHKTPSEFRSGPAG